MKPHYLWIGFGSALGGMSRHWLSGVVAHRFGETFPWGTLLVNVSGSFAIGFFAALTAPGGRGWASPALREFFMFGLCGGYTTFSSFSLQTLQLAEEGEWTRAGANILLSVVFCLLAAWIGHWLASQLNALKGA